MAVDGQEHDVQDFVSGLANASVHPKNDGNGIGAVWHCCLRMLFLFRVLVSHLCAVGRDS